MDFGFGPMSTEIIESVYQYSHQHKTDLMLIASKNQIDYDGGYVNNWTTEEYVQYLAQMQNKYPQSDIMICRDHCGPGFKKQDNDSLYDTNRTIAEDIHCGFDLLHIDLCHFTTSKLFLHTQNIIKATCACLEYARKLNPDIEFEIGTDDIENDCQSVETITEEMRNFNVLNNFDPLYYVVNTGSLIKENKQVGHFNNTLLKDLQIDLIDLNWSIKIKEHNADYLSAKQIQLRQGCVDAMNIAPQLGVVQTMTVLSECQKYGINVDNFVNLVYNKGRWRKWEQKKNSSLTGNPYLSTIIAGHYHYMSDEYKRLIDQLGEDDDDWYIKSHIIDNIKDVIHYYVTANH